MIEERRLVSEPNAENKVERSMAEIAKSIESVARKFFTFIDVRDYIKKEAETLKLEDVRSILVSLPPHETGGYFALVERIREEARLNNPVGSEQERDQASQLLEALRSFDALLNVIETDGKLAEMNGELEKIITHARVIFSLSNAMLSYTTDLGFLQRRQNRVGEIQTEPADGEVGLESRIETAKEVAVQKAKEAEQEEVVVLLEKAFAAIDADIFDEKLLIEVHAKIIELNRRAGLFRETALGGRFNKLAHDLPTRAEVLHLIAELEAFVKKPAGSHNQPASTAAPEGTEA